MTAWTSRALCVAMPLLLCLGACHRRNAPEGEARRRVPRGGDAGPAPDAAPRPARGLLAPPEDASLLGLSPCGEGLCTVWLEGRDEPSKEVTLRRVGPSGLGPLVRREPCGRDCAEPILLSSGDEGEALHLVTRTLSPPTTLYSRALGAEPEPRVVGRLEGFHEEAGSSVAALRAGPVAEGILAWVGQRGDLVHECSGQGEDEICRWTETDPRRSLRIAVLRKGGSRVHTLEPWRAGLDWLYGVAVSASKVGEAVVWERAIGEAGHQLAVARIDPSGALGLWEPTTTPESFAEGMTALLTDAGELCVYGVRRPGGTALPQIGVACFTSAGTALEPRLLEADVAWPAALTAFECEGRLWLVFAAVDERSRELQLRVVASTVRGPLERLGALWSSGAPTPEGAAPLQDSFEIHTACRGGLGAIAGVASTPRGHGLLFATWPAR